MNIIIHNVSKKLDQLVEELEKIENVSISFALDEKNLIELVNNFKPDYIYIGKYNISVELDNFLYEKTNITVYYIDDLC